MGRDPTLCPRCRLQFLVSTHAPAWGATILSTFLSAMVMVSTHAPAWGATLSPWILFQNKVLFQPTRPHGARRIAIVSDDVHVMFQPTRPHGARLFLSIFLSMTIAVSTHAPAWGATRSPESDRPMPTCFNPRARMGRDLSSIYIPLIDSQFQPTRPHGARLNFASKN